MIRMFALSALALLLTASAGSAHAAPTRPAPRAPQTGRTFSYEPQRDVAYPSARVMRGTSNASSVHGPLRNAASKALGNY